MASCFDNRRGYEVYPIQGSVNGNGLCDWYSRTITQRYPFVRCYSQPLLGSVARVSHGVCLRVLFCVFRFSFINTRHCLSPARGSRVTFLARASCQQSFEHFQTSSNRAFLKCSGCGPAVATSTSSQLS